MASGDIKSFSSECVATFLEIGRGRGFCEYFDYKNLAARSLALPPSHQIRATLGGLASNGQHKLFRFWHLFFVDVYNLLQVIDLVLELRYRVFRSGRFTSVMQLSSFWIRTLCFLMHMIFPKPHCISEKSKFDSKSSKS